MQFLKDLCRAFLRADPPPATVFKLVYRNGEQISLSFIDRQRLLRNFQCRIHAIRSNTLFLNFTDPLAADLFNKEKCHLYFKLPNEVIKEKLHIRQNPEQNGFLCKSNILDYGSADASGKVRQIRVRMPQKYIRRELRRHERYSVFAGMIAKACLCFVPLENTPRRPDGPITDCAGSMFPLHLADISAGGAKVVIEQVDFLEEFARLESYSLMLRLTLNIAFGEKLDTWLACRCVKSNYSINLRRFSLRLEFVSSALPEQLLPHVRSASSVDEESGACVN